ncbi:MAG TPA: hypothetical protein PKC21_02490 [Oligoflexia bacterium]|nr:hypothetical protein [Oligoflexia bacterium]HMR24199.1 hypothetical protein [Oligoflexia bacterium]
MQRILFGSVLLLLLPCLWAQKIVVKVYPELHGIGHCPTQTEKLKTFTVLKDNFYLGLENQLAFEGQSLNPFGLESPRIHAPGHYFLHMIIAYLNQANMIYHANGNAVPHHNEKVYVSLRNALRSMKSMFGVMEKYENYIPEYAAIVLNDRHMIHDLQQVISVYNSVDTALKNNNLTVVANLNPINDAMTSYLDYFYQEKKAAVMAIVDDPGLAEAKTEHGIAKESEINDYKNNLINLTNNQINFINQIHPELMKEYIEYSLINKNYMFLDNIYEYIQENTIEPSDTLSVIVGKNHVFGMQRLMQLVPRFADTFELDVQADCANIEDYNAFKK